MNFKKIFNTECIFEILPFWVFTAKINKPIIEFACYIQFYTVCTSKPALTVQ